MLHSNKIVKHILNRIYNDPLPTNFDRSIFSLYATGGGSDIVSWLFSVAGASKSIVDVRIPYAYMALEECMYDPDSVSGHRVSAEELSCSQTTAERMAHEARMKTLKLLACETRNINDLTVHNAIGIGCTASLATVQPKRGKHRCHVAVDTKDYTIHYHMNLQKTSSTTSGCNRVREEENELVSLLLLFSLADACFHPVVTTSHGIGDPSFYPPTYMAATPAHPSVASVQSIGIDVTEGDTLCTTSSDKLRHFLWSCLSTMSSTSPPPRAQQQPEPELLVDGEPVLLYSSNFGHDDASGDVCVGDNSGDCRHVDADDIDMVSRRIVFKYNNRNKHDSCEGSYRYCTINNVLVHMLSVTDIGPRGILFTPRQLRVSQSPRVISPHVVDDMFHYLPLVDTFHSQGQRGIGVCVVPPPMTPHTTNPWPPHSLVFPGSYNPLHHGHLALLDACVGYIHRHYDPSSGTMSHQHHHHHHLEGKDSHCINETIMGKKQVDMKVGYTLPILFEISVTNVDKPALPIATCITRLQQFHHSSLFNSFNEKVNEEVNVVGDVSDDDNNSIHGINYSRYENIMANNHNNNSNNNIAVCMTTAAYFIDKSAIFPHSIFIIGADTLVRLFNPKYYANGSVVEMFIALHRIVTERRCMFIVGGRVVSVPVDSLAGTSSNQDVFETMNDVFDNIEKSLQCMYTSKDNESITIPPRIRNAFHELPSGSFRVDLSSTEIRARRNSND